MATLRQSISINFADLDDHALSDYVGNVLRGLTGNLLYPVPTPALADAEAVIAAYIKSLGEAKVGGRAAVARKGQLRGDIEVILAQWSAYATTATPDHPVSWLSANFRLTKAERAKAQPLPAPVRFQTLEGPRRGTIRVRQSAQRSVRAYIVEYAPLDSNGQPGAWGYCLSSTADCLLEDLVSGNKYIIRAGAWNGTSTPNFSDPEQRIVQ